MESLSPNLFVRDITQTIAFYGQLGFNVIASVPETGTPVWAMMSSGAVTVMFQTYQSLGEELPEIHRNDGGSLLLYIKLKNIRTFFETLQGKVTVLKGLEKTFYGALSCKVIDPFHNQIIFNEKIEGEGEDKN